MKTESLLAIFCSLLQVFNDIKDNYKIKSLRTPSLCANKVQGILVYIKNKKRGEACMIISKGTVHFKYVSKE